ncbi:MAG: hypothetical protein RL518_1467 [Pseudomonadota bacterium]
MVDKLSVDRKGEVFGATNEGVRPNDEGGWERALLVPQAHLTIEQLREFDQGARGDSGGVTSRRCVNLGDALPSSRLFKELGHTKLLTQAQEIQICSAIQGYLNDLRTQLFSFMPIAREAARQLTDSLSPNYEVHISKLLLIGPADPVAYKTSAIERTRSNMKTVQALLERCTNDSTRLTAGDDHSGCRASAELRGAADRAKIGALFAELPLRPEFVRKYHADFRSLMDTIEGLRGEIAKTTDGQIGKRMAERLHEHLSSTHETLETSLKRAELIRNAHEGYALAHSIMVKRNLPLVVSIAKRFVGSGEPMDDLFQDGVRGLATAADLFDPQLGYRFTTYATPWIRLTIRRSLEEGGGPVRLPGNVASVLRRIYEFETAFRAEHNRAPSFEEIAAKFADESVYPKPTVEWLREVMPIARSVGSIESRVSGVSDRFRVKDTIVDRSESPTDAINRKIIAADIKDVLQQKLNARQCEVIMMRFGLDGEEPLTLDRASQILQVTKERVRQIEKNALEILRSSPLARYVAVN